MNNSNLESTLVTDKSVKNLNAVLYGEYGMWKTSTAASCINATEKKRGLLIATDLNWHVLENHEGLLDKFDIMKYDGISQLAAVASNTEEYDLIILDTISQMQEEYIDFLLDHATYKGNFRESLQMDKLNKSELLEIPGIADYHVARNKMRGPIKALVKAPVDVFFITHLRVPSPLKPSDIVKRPSLTESVFKIIARESQIIGFCNKNAKEDFARIQFKTDNTTIAKSQIASLENQVIDARELVQYIQNWKVK